MLAATAAGTRAPWPARSPGARTSSERTPGAATAAFGTVHLLLAPGSPGAPRSVPPLAASKIAAIATLGTS
jgi:hypothetical protein